MAQNIQVTLPDGSKKEVSSVAGSWKSTRSISTVLTW
jgi:hypothetical protein